MQRPASITDHVTMHTMSEDELRRFLIERPRTMMLATVRPDGRPHGTPVWFDLDGDSIVFTTGERYVKGHDMRRDPRVCLCADDETPPFAYVMIEGTAAL